MDDKEAFVLINQMIGMLMCTERKKKLTELGNWTKKLIEKKDKG